MPEKVKNAAAGTANFRRSLGDLAPKGKKADAHITN